MSEADALSATAAPGATPAAQPSEALQQEGASEQAEQQQPAGEANADAVQVNGLAEVDIAGDDTHDEGSAPAKDGDGDDDDDDTIAPDDGDDDADNSNDNSNDNNSNSNSKPAAIFDLSDPTDITVMMPSLEQGTGMFKQGHMQYQVKVLQPGGKGQAQEPVLRRYSDFFWLREVLVSAFPGVFIAPLPPKSMMVGLTPGSKKNHRFLQERRHRLEAFLRRICQLEFVQGAQSFQAFMFLMDPVEFGHAKKELAANIGYSRSKTVANYLMGQVLPDTVISPSQGEASIYELYKTTLFADVMRQPLPKEPEDQIASLKEFLTEQARLLTQLETTARSLATNTAAIAKHWDGAKQTLAALEGSERDVSQNPNLFLTPPRVSVLYGVRSNLQAMNQCLFAYGDELVRALASELADTQAFLELVRNWEIVQVRLAKADRKCEKWEDEHGKPLPAPANEKKAAQREKALAKREEEATALACLTKLLLLDQVHRVREHGMRATQGCWTRFFQRQKDMAGASSDAWRSIHRDTGHTSGASSPRDSVAAAEKVSDVVASMPEKASEE